MTPIVTKMEVYPVAGKDCMELNLSGAHAPYFTPNIVILTDSTGATGAFGAASCFSGTKADFGAPHHGHTQVSGRSVKAFSSFASS